MAPKTALGAADAAPAQVLVVGEALIDVVHRQDGTVDEHPGGSPANVAITLGRLGRPVELLAWLGEDAYGSMIRRWLGASGVALAPGATGAAQTSIATAHSSSACNRRSVCSRMPLRMGSNGCGA